MRPKLVFPTEVLLAMGAFGSRSTMLGEIIVAMEILFRTAGIGAWVGFVERFTLFAVGN
jgi:hypothetical protein